MAIVKAPFSGQCTILYLMWTLFPHIFLILSLMAYAVLGAVLFEKIEGGRDNETNKDYQRFLQSLVVTVHNNSDNSDLLLKIEDKIEKDFQPIWLQRPERWHFFGSLFFCCTVFTTVGYGEIFPVTVAGKVVCIFYAMVGIPLMLLVISDVGDILAVMLSRAYIRLYRIRRRLLRCTWNRCRNQDKASKQHQVISGDSTYTFSQDVVMCEPMDIRCVIRTQRSVKRKSIQLQTNTEIFDRIIAKENFTRNSPLARSCSCPELDRMPRLSKDWDFASIGQEMDKFNVPLILILLVVFAYILFGSLILRIWEREFGFFDAFYFCFITLTTIGFGDFVPRHPNFFMLTFIFIISGMAIMSMAFKLGQSHIVRFYHRGMRFLSGGKVAKYNFLRKE
ncbi:potassium channel subfamily K member 18 [Chanos chanos]|uniref:Potassium channel subfamily K member 18 n=1 Tax=Chanos chanos TaxID=29144 RepID=A0A6J2WHT1_CHACN|nr:potassium channel subfamily K member 18 [Chanos chanos]